MANPHSPFPLRFVRTPHQAGRGPHPGELLPFVHPTGDAKMSLSTFFPAQSITDIVNHGSIILHAMGDSGVGSQDQQDVADAMSRDVNVAHPAQSPAFLLHLGDLIYGSNKRQAYASRFYQPNANYHNLIFAIPGNHDGEIRTPDTTSLEAYFENFCQPVGTQPPAAVISSRPMPHQPGAYWRMTCPFVDIIGLYSGTGENFAAIAHPDIGNQQKTWLQKTLSDIATERAAGKKQALIIASHHPPFASGLQSSSFGHPGNPEMLKDIDDCCTAASVWPDAFLSGHSHNYQRYMRTVTVAGQSKTIPYLIAGAGGHPTQPAPMPVGTVVGNVTYANGADGYGFLTVTVSATTLSFTYTKTSGSHRNIFETGSVTL